MIESLAISWPFAHSLPGRPPAEWEPLDAHLRAVSTRAAEFASRFGWERAAVVAGLLHDIGKLSARFQAYIATPPGDAGAKGPDHSTAGARVAYARYGKALGRMLAAIIAAHHAGLDDAENLERRLDDALTSIEPHEGWEALTGPLPEAASLAPNHGWRPGAELGFSKALLTRMLFSCLVDADFLETENFHRQAEGKADQRGGHASIPELRDRLRRHMAGIDGKAEDPVSLLRSRVLRAAVEKAALPPGLFTLTVPTGGGKTLASLSFALEHAVRHGLRRVIHVAPFTAIIEQTAQVFRHALATEEDVLEHHSQAGWREDRGDDEGRGGERKLALAAENWDVPVVATTAVQFFESLFANRTSRCRKLHNLAGAVIVLDEAQAMPLGLLKPCVAALRELAHGYGATVVLCTATQPALRKQDGQDWGLDICDGREIAPDPPALYAALRRVTLEVVPEKVPDAAIAARFAEVPQMLCIVNSRAHAGVLFQAIRHLPGAMHLSTLMVPLHRRRVLEEVRRRVAAGEPVRLVSTSLIEAGVDLDLPEVWRAKTGLDSIAQAAGRCNRNGRLAMGRVVVFEPAEAPMPRYALEFAQAAETALRRQGADPLGLAAIQAYFTALYDQRSDAALDALVLPGRKPGVLPALEMHAKDGRFPFRSLAENFRMIDEAMDPVVVPWDDEARQLLAALAGMERPSGRMLRALQAYTVAIPATPRRWWLERGALRAVHPLLGDGLLAFADTEHYDRQTGIRLERPELRSAEKNLF
jgi:CRISPR-associated endonuclease/helicase Cas3